MGFDVVGQIYSPRRCVAVRGVLDEIGVDLSSDVPVAKWHET